MRLFGSFCLFVLMATAGADAYKLCMAEHVKPTSCTKSGDYDTWILTCTGGTVKKINGHCTGTYHTYVVGSDNEFDCESYDANCTIDTIISNGQIVYFNLLVSKHTDNRCFSSGTYLLTNYKPIVYSQLNTATVISKIPF
jgi:hypothetical protein